MSSQPVGDPGGDHEPVVPVLLFDGLDLDVFRSAEDLVRYVEPVDARDNTFDVFDATGLRLILTGSGVQEGGRWLRWVAGGETSLAISRPPVREPEVLATKIREHIADVGIERFVLSADVDELDLRSLVAAVAAFHLSGA